MGQDLSLRLAARDSRRALNVRLISAETKS